MIPTFIGAGAIATDVSGGASTTPTPPTHVADDILIAVSFNQAAAVQSTVTSGWNQLQSSGGNRFNSWWKRATGAGTAGPTITAASTDQFSICYGFRGCITTGDPFEHKNAAGETTSTTPQGGGWSTSDGWERLAVFFVANDDDTVYSGLPPAGWTLANDSSTATGTQARFTVVTKEMRYIGQADSPVIGTLATSEIWWMVYMYFVPQAPLPPPGYTRTPNNVLVRM